MGTEPYWQYAREALLAALKAKTDEDRDSLLELARTWIDAALIEQHALAERQRRTAA